MNERLIADILESIVLDDFEGRTLLEEGRLFTIWENGAWAVAPDYVLPDGSFDREKWRRETSYGDDDDGQEWDDFVQVVKDGGRAFADDGTPLEEGIAIKALRIVKELRARDSQGRGDLSPSRVSAQDLQVLIDVATMLDKMDARPYADVIERVHAALVSQPSPVPSALRSEVARLLDEAEYIAKETGESWNGGQADAYKRILALIDAQPSPWNYDMGAFPGSERPVFITYRADSNGYVGVRHLHQSVWVEGNGYPPFAWKFAPPMPDLPAGDGDGWSRGMEDYPRGEDRPVYLAVNPFARANNMVIRKDRAGFPHSAAWNAYAWRYAEPTPEPAPTLPNGEEQGS